MTPLQFEAGSLLIVGHILLSVLCVLIAEQEGTTVAVALDVVRGCRQAPRALGIDLAQQLQVHLIRDGKVITTIAQVEATTGLIAIGRHDQTTAIVLGEGEEAVGDCQWQRHIGHHEIGWSKDHILTWANLGTRHGNIKVRMGIVTSGIAAMFEEHLTISTTFGVLTGQETVFLLGVDIGDEAFLGLEVEHHLSLLILIATHLKHRRSHHLMRRGVHFSRGIDQVAVEAHADILTGKVHVLVFHLRTTKKEGARRASLIDKGVVGRILHGGVDTVLTTFVDTITC